VPKFYAVYAQYAEATEGGYLVRADGRKNPAKVSPAPPLGGARKEPAGPPPIGYTPFQPEAGAAVAAVAKRDRKQELSAQSPSQWPANSRGEIVVGETLAGIDEGEGGGTDEMDEDHSEGHSDNSGRNTVTAPMSLPPRFRSWWIFGGGGGGHVSTPQPSGAPSSPEPSRKPESGTMRGKPVDAGSGGAAAKHARGETGKVGGDESKGAPGSGSDPGSGASRSGAVSPARPPRHPGVGERRPSGGAIVVSAGSVPATVSGATGVGAVVSGTGTAVSGVRTGTAAAPPSSGGPTSAWMDPLSSDDGLREAVGRIERNGDISTIAPGGTEASVAGGVVSGTGTAATGAVAAPS